MPVIRIDDEVYAALQRLGRAFEDTPNDVLRRLLELRPRAADTGQPVPERDALPVARSSSERLLAPPVNRTYEDLNSRFERLRTSYRPERVSLLFVGESRPAGGTFFYAGDSNLFRYTAQAFGCSTPADHKRFLEVFKNSGCFLTDLCATPITQLPNAARLTERTKGEAALAALIKERPPNAIVIVMKSLRLHVDRAIAAAGVPIGKENVFYLPFPVQGHQQEYVAELKRILRHLQDAGSLRLRR